MENASTLTSPDLDAQGRTQQSSTGATAGGVTDTQIRDEDIGGGERLTMENADHAGFLFSNLKSFEAMLAGLSHAEANARARHLETLGTLAAQSLAQSQAIAAQAAQNGLALANMIGQNAALVSHQISTNLAHHSNRQNNNGTTWDDRQKTLADRNQDIATDSQWNPIQQGTADTLTSAGYPANRAVDTATAGVAVSADAVAASVANAVTASLTPLIGVIADLVKAMSAK